MASGTLLTARLQAASFEKSAAVEEANHPFEAKAFLDSWWENLAGKFPVYAREGQMVGVKRPVLKGLYNLKSLRIAGWNNYYYQDLTETRFEEFLTLSRTVPWDYFEMYWNTAYTDEKNFEIFRHFGYEPVQQPAMPSPIIDINQGWEAYWQGRSAKYRRDLNKKMTTLAPLNPSLVYYNEPDAIDTFFERFFPLHWRYWDEKTGQSFYHDPREQTFIKAWCHRLAEAGQLELTGLSLGGEIANLGLNIVFNQTMYCILTMNTGVHLDCHPGLVSMHLTVQDACAKGLEKIDIGPGETHYKRKIATDFEECKTLLVFNPKSIASRFYAEKRMAQHYQPELQQ